jgi:fibronectin-binding autotransporter adhesin
MKPKSRNLLFSLGTALIATSTAHADTIYWDGTNAAWGTNTNWTTNPAAATPDPVSAPGALDDAIFNRTDQNTNITISLDAARAANSLTFNSTGATTFRANNAADLTVRTLSIGSGGITMNAGAGAVTFGNNQGTNGNVEIALTAAQNWTNNSSNLLFLNTATANALTGSADLGINGTGRVSLTGLAGATGYSGNITISGGGELEARSNITTNGVFGTGNINVTGGNIGLYFGNTLTRAIGAGAGAIQFSSGISGISGNGSSGSTFNISGMQWNTAAFNPTEFLFQNSTANSNGVGTLNANIDLNNGTRTIRSDQTVDSAYLGNGTITGNITTSAGTAGLIKTGIGQITLNGTNTYTLGTAINQGTLRFNTRLSMSATGNVSVANGATLGITVAGSGTTWGAGTGNGGIAGLVNGGLGGQAGSTVTFAGNSSLQLNVTGGTVNETTALGNGAATNLSLIKVGTVAMTLSGQNTYSGGTIVGNGTLNLGHATNTLLNTGAVTVTGGTLALGANSDTVGAVTLTGGTISSSTGVLTGSSYAAQAGTISAILGGSGGLTKTTGGTLILSSGYNGTGGLWTVQAGTLQLNGTAHAFSDGLTMTGGTLSVVAGTTISGGLLTLSGGVTLSVPNSGAGTIINNNQLWNGNIATTLVSASGQTITSTGSVTLGANVQASNKATMIFDGAIGETGGARNLTVTNNGGTNTFIVNGTNTYSGSTTLNSGTFRVGGAGSLGSGNYSGAISLANSTSFQYSSSADQILGGNITGGTGSLTKNTSSSSVLTLSGTNSYTGGSTVSAGTLTFGKIASKATTGTHAFAAGTTLGLGVGGTGFFSATDVTNAFAGTMTGNLSNVTVTTTTNVGLNTSAGDFTYATTIAGNPTKGLAKLGTNKLTLTGTNTYTGQTIIRSGTLEIGSGGLTGSIAGTSGVTNNAALIYNRSNDLSVGYAIGGTGTLEKRGAGTLTLTSTNTYTGATTVTAGSLIINGAVASTSVVVNGSLGGSGVMANATLSGSGSINPGNSPGILTASATDPTGGLAYNFEFTAAGTEPTWNNATASVNDVLRLTSATPFTADLTGANILSVYFNVGSLTNGDVFTGGFYADTTDFLSSISGAAFNYYLANAGGGVSYGGNNYDLYTGPLTINFGTALQTADFGGGDVTGYTTQFTVVPEPNVAALLGGLGAMLLLRRRR